MSFFLSPSLYNSLQGHQGPQGPIGPPGPKGVKVKSHFLWVSVSFVFSLMFKFTRAKCIHFIHIHFWAYSTMRNFHFYFKLQHTHNTHTKISSNISFVVVQGEQGDDGKITGPPGPPGLRVSSSFCLQHTLFFSHFCVSLVFSKL